MIVASSGQIATNTGHDHGTAPTPTGLITRVRLKDHDKWFRPACRRYLMMAAHGWEEDQRWKLALAATLIKECLT
jgi:hypothetical protein